MLALVAKCVQRGLGDERVVFRKIIDELDVLVDRAGVVLHTSKRGDQATAQNGDLGFARIRRKWCIVEERDFVEIEFPQALIVARLRVSIRHGRKVFGVVRRIFQKLGEQIARLLILFRTSRFAGCLICELLA